MTQKKYEPPDGGWGWMVVVAFSINFTTIIPMMQLFGLIFREKLELIGLSATDISVIINTNQAFGMLMGLVNGFLLKKMGYRKVAVISSICITTGIIFTGFSNSFVGFLFTYGMIYSLGCGMGTSAHNLALNTYFLKKRSKALGMALSISGLSPIFMPQLVTYLLNRYGEKGTAVIMGALASNSFIGAALLQPVKRHMKVVEVLEDTQQTSKTQIGRKISQGNRLQRTKSMTKSSLSIDHDVDSSSIYGFDSQNLNLSRTSLATESAPVRKQSVFGSYVSLESVHEENHDENQDKELFVEDINANNLEESETEKKKSALIGCFKIISDIFDLTLLCDPIYVNIMLGISIAIFSELNFSMLTALMLSEFGLNNEQAATFMSILAISDLVLRFLSPYIGDYFKQPPRIMYMVSLVLLALTRFIFISVQGYTLLLISAVGLGIAKGLRIIYMSLVIPSYVPLEKLPGASGIQMVTNGILFIIGGPFLGFIKDVTGTYRKCVVLMNLMTLLTVVMWFTEMLIVKVRSKRKEGYP